VGSLTSCPWRQGKQERSSDVPGFGSPDPGARKFLVLLEKEFKDGHRRNLSRSRLSNEGKVKAGQKYTFQIGGWAGSTGSVALGGPKTSNFDWGL
jgi:hypothetical protein